MLDQLQAMLPGFRVYTVPYEGGVEYHAQLPGNPLYTEQAVGVDTDGSLGWSGEQECGDELWIAIHTLLGRDLPAPVAKRPARSGKISYKERSQIRFENWLRGYRVQTLAVVAIPAGTVYDGPVRVRPVRIPKGWSLRQVRAAEMRAIDRTVRTGSPIRGRRMLLQRSNPGLYMGQSGHGDSDSIRMRQPVGYRIMMRKQQAEWVTRSAAQVTDI